jgi:CspA family cold shock protein
VYYVGESRNGQVAINVKSDGGNETEAPSAPPLSAQHRKQGRVKWFNEARGFGTILPEGASQTEKGDFVHINNVEGGQLRQGDRVEYEVGPGRKGPEAKNVSRL